MRGVYAFLATHRALHPDRLGALQARPGLFRMLQVAAVWFRARAVLKSESTRHIAVAGSKPACSQNSASMLCPRTLSINELNGISSLSLSNAVSYYQISNNATRPGESPLVHIRS